MGNGNGYGKGQLPVVYHPGWCDGQPSPVAGRAVAPAGVVAQPGRRLVVLELGSALGTPVLLLHQAQLRTDGVQQLAVVHRLGLLRQQLGDQGKDSYHSFGGQEDTQNDFNTGSL